MNAALYRIIWRWHFYAAVYVLPLMIVLALSGTLFLFKPQIERWEERAYHNLPFASAPGAKLNYYLLPEPHHHR